MSTSINDEDASNTFIGNVAMQDLLRALSNSTNVSKWGIELPMIAVFGDTSSGKSSLLSNLAMIELPSNHSLTTRCPTRLEIRRAETREARITVQNQTNKHCTDLPAFNERIANEDNWGSIPQLIQEAQAHILQHNRKTVAPDIISLSVSGPNLGVTADHPLTLIDLPGWVQSRGQDDAEDMVPDIQHLLKNYINNPRCIILAVLPGNVDFHNSPILALAQLVDPEGHRTLPVITKPDLIDEGGEGNVLDLLLGNKVKLNGDNQFHMIKGRGQAALDKNVSIHVGLEDEAKYFDTEEPWKSVADRTLFGTSELRRKLGAILLQHVQQTVPVVLEEIQAKQQLAEARRIAMGGDQILSTVADRRRFYQDTCSSFVHHLKASLSGKKEGGAGRSTHCSLRSGEPASTSSSAVAANATSSAASQLYEACSTFTTNIRNGSLNTVRAIVEGAQVLVTSPNGDVRGEVVHLDKEFACIDCIDVDNEQDNTGILFEYRGYTSQQKLEEDDVWSDGEQIFVARKGNVFDCLRKIPLDLVRTDPLWLKHKIVENRTDDLGCFLNVDVFKNIVENFIKTDWEPHCQTLLDSTRDILMATVNESMDSNLPKYTIRYPRLRRYLEKQCRVVAEDLMQGARKQVSDHLDIEKHPYTQDQVLFDNIAEARHRGLKRELEAALKLDQAKQNVYDTEAIRTIVDGVFERSRRKSAEDHMAEEMEIVLEAYGKVVTKRVVDRTPMICWQVFRSLSSSIQDSLWSVTDEALTDYMQESSEFTKEYNELIEELEEMNRALQSFASILN